jgi:hypothetical protein
MRIIKTLTLAVVTLAFTASLAAAAPILTGGYNYISFDGFENVYGRTAETINDPLVDGDVIYGVLQAGNIKTETGSVVTQPMGSELTGFFAASAQYVDGLLTLNSLQATNDTYNYYTVTDGAVTWNDAGLGSIMGSIFSADELAGYSVMKLFSDLTGDVNSPDLATSIATHTNGEEWATMALTPGDSYWYTQLAPEGFGTNLYGFQSYGPAPWGNALINDPTESLFDYDVALFGEADISANANPLIPWLLDIADPAVIATPEPSTFLILGLGLLGLLGFRRKFQN